MSLPHLTEADPATESPPNTPPILAPVTATTSHINNQQVKPPFPTRTIKTKAYLRKHPTTESPPSTPPILTPVTAATSHTNNLNQQVKPPFPTRTLTSKAHLRKRTKSTTSLVPLQLNAKTTIPPPTPPKMEYFCRDLRGKKHDIKELRKLRNKSVLKGMKFMKKFL